MVFRIYSYHYLFKYVLDDYGHSYYDLNNEDMLLISGNLFLIVRKCLLCVSKN